MANPPALKKGRLGTSLTIRSGDDLGITLRGAGHKEAQDFSEAVKTAVSVGWLPPSPGSSDLRFRA